MELTVLSDHIGIAKQAAAEIANEIRNKNSNSEYFVLGLATGATMDPLYAELIKMYKAGSLSFKQVKFFNLDNYIGLKPDDINSYDVQLKIRFLDHIDALEQNIDLVSSDPNFNHQAYEARIKAAGGIDYQLLGIGRNGHIGFNEKGSDANSITRVIMLSQETLEDNSKFFNRIDNETNKSESIPVTAHTRGIASILEAEKIICLANGHGKAQTIKKLFEDSSVEALPVRALLSHANVTILVDYEALALFNATDLQTHTFLKMEQHEEVLKKNQYNRVHISINDETHSLILPPQFDFYFPEKMGITEQFDYTNPKHIKLLVNTLYAAKNLTIGAHPDDAEIMAGPMMLQSTADNPWLTLIVTNGAATNNTLKGEFSQLSPEELTLLRQREQRQAAKIANVPVIMCKFPSPAISGYMGQDALNAVNETMQRLIGAMANLNNVYGHNPYDEHDTHVFTFLAQVEALRCLSHERLTQINTYGMEVWGTFSVSSKREMKIVVSDEQLLEKWHQTILVYKSQIASQERDYSLATINRAKGHTGFKTSPYSAAPPKGLLSGIELTDLVCNKSIPVLSFTDILSNERLTQDSKRKLRLSTYIGDTKKRHFENTSKSTTVTSNSIFTTKRARPTAQELKANPTELSPLISRASTL